MHTDAYATSLIYTHCSHPLILPLNMLVKEVMLVKTVMVKGCDANELLVMEVVSVKLMMVVMSCAELFMKVMLCRY